MTSFEKNLLSRLKPLQLQKDLEVLSRFQRLSGSPDELRALSYITDRLDQAGISWTQSSYPALLSNPKSAFLSIAGRSIPALTRSFSGTNTYPVSGLLTAFEETRPLSMAELGASFPFSPSLAGRIAFGHSGSIPHILAAQYRGALAYIHIWEGAESLLHEGNVSPLWGAPQPEETQLLPAIPVLTISQQSLPELSLSTPVTLHAQVHTRVQEIPVLEAYLPPLADSPYYLLAGSHIDSWYYGATDNATGNALMLSLACLLSDCPHRQHGLRLVWWPGHSNGRYAGSAGYARRNFSSLYRHGLAYMNIDMPGLRGAADYSLITAGSELYALAQACVAEITGHNGRLSEPVRGWDQSFQNLGLSSYFIWSSLLPASHKDTTHHSRMSYWWHTPQDLPVYADLSVLLRDTELYSLAAYRLLSQSAPAYDLTALLNQMLQSGQSCNLRPFLQDLNNSIQNWLHNTAPSWERLLPILRKLNQMLYTEKASHLQDRAWFQNYFPGLTGHNHSPLPEIPAFILQEYDQSQRNRLYQLAADICDFLL